jgi:hypothetical protein
VSEAIAAYRTALDAQPFGQAAAVALGAALVVNHQPAEAASLVNQMLSLPSAPYDPWFTYVAPDYRFWPGLRTQLREAIHP